MSAIESLVVDLLEQSGIERLDIKTRAGLELPGYYRPEKKWDLLAIADGQLIVALEFKSQVGPSFGNNYNNRVEEAIGNATDIWTAFREGLLGDSRPLLGYFFLLEDTARVHTPVRLKNRYFPIDPAFKDVSYSQRYALLCQRLVLERLYDVTCLTLATNSTETVVTHPVPVLDFERFAAHLQGHVSDFVR